MECGDVHTRVTDCATREVPLYREESPSIKRCELTGTQRHPPPPRTQESAPINPDHDRQRRVDVDTGGPEYVECETVLRSGKWPLLWNGEWVLRERRASEDGGLRPASIPYRNYGHRMIARGKVKVWASDERSGGRRREARRKGYLKARG